MRAMRQLNSTDRRTLRARAHPLHPLVIISSAGLADSVMAEIERCLKAHELIKIRVFSDDRSQREALLAQICERTGASPVQHIGKILVVYRQNPEPPAPKRPPAAKSKAKAPRKSDPYRRSEDPRPGSRSAIPRRQTARPASRRRP
jgi:RNA-binding protein